MNYPVNDFKTKWYDAQPYGTKTSYGFHDGADLNLGTGGDSDLGQPLLAICDGTISSVHSHLTNFGNHIHLEFLVNNKTYYAHYAHCKDIFVKLGDTVKEGQKIATVGKSGTTWGHCHFAIKNQPTGVDGIARTLEDLKKWEDPLKFIEANLGNVIISPPNQMNYKEIYDFTGNIKGLEDRSPKPDFYAPADEFKKAYVDKTTNRSYIVSDLKVFNDTLSYLRDEIEKGKQEIIRLNNLLNSELKPLFATTGGDNFTAVVDKPVEVKPDLDPNPALEWDPITALWNKISQLWKR